MAMNATQLNYVRSALHGLSLSSDPNIAAQARRMLSLDDAPNPPAPQASTPALSDFERARGELALCAAAGDKRAKRALDALEGRSSTPTTRAVAPAAATPSRPPTAPTEAELERRLAALESRGMPPAASATGDARRDAWLEEMDRRMLQPQALSTARVGTVQRFGLLPRRVSVRSPAAVGPFPSSPSSTPSTEPPAREEFDALERRVATAEAALEEAREEIARLTLRVQELELNPGGTGDPDKLPKSDEARAMDLRMGVSQPKATVRRIGNRQEFGIF